MSTRQNPPSTDDSQIHKSWLFTQNPDGTLSPADLSKSNIFINGALPSFTNPLPVELSDGTQAFGTASNPLGINIAKVGAAAVSLGAKTSANSIPVVLASDEAALNTKDGANVAPAAAVPSLLEFVGGKVNTNPPVYSDATANALSLDVNGGLRTVGTVTPVTSATWTSATAAGTHVDINCAGMGSVVAIISTTAGTFSTGQLRFFAESSGSFGFDISGMRMHTQGGSFQQVYDADHTLTLLTNDAYSYWFPVSGFTVFRVYLNTAITGSGSVNISLQAAPSTITGPTTVGQSDATKLNATVTGAVTTTGAISSTANAVWNSSTAISTTLSVASGGMSAVKVEFVCDGGTFTQGSIAFRVGGMLGHVTGMRQSKFGEQLYDAASTFTPATGVSYIYWFEVGGLDNFSLVLETVIAGTGNVTIAMKATAQPIPGPTTVGQSDASKLNATVLGAMTPSSTTFTWSSATPQGTSISISTVGYGGVMVGLTTNSGTFTAGILSFGIFAGSVTQFATGMRVGPSGIQQYDATDFHVPATSQTYTYWFNVAGCDAFFVYNSTAITGTGTVTVQIKAVAATPTGPTTVGQSDPTKLNVSLGRAASSLTVGNPAAGTDFNITVGATGLFQTFRARFIASAAAANRNMNFILQDAGGNTLYAQQMAFNVTASQGVDFYMGLALPLSAAANAGGQVYIPIPQMVLQNGWKIIVATANIQAGDQWSGLGYSIETS